MATLTIAPGLAPFATELFVDFSTSGNKAAMESALATVASHLGREYDLVIGGKRLRTEGKIISTNPANPSQVVGIHQRAAAEHAETAMLAAQQAFHTWSRTSVSDRVDLLLRAAALIRERKFLFCAWLTYEVGKNWAEADADVAECIDFLEFYAREALRLDAATTPNPVPRRTQPPPLHPPRRRCRHPALELPLRHHGRHDRRRYCHREHSHPETFSGRFNNRRYLLQSA